MQTEEGSFACTYPGCGAVFRHRTGCYTHMRRHRGIYLYHCPYCNKGLSATRDIKYHLRKYHTGLLGYHCVTCKQEFKNVKMLKLHLEQKKCSLTTD